MGKITKSVLLGAMVLIGLTGRTHAQASRGEQVGALPLVQWTEYSDPVEGAFKLSVPRGWKVAGGTRRLNALQVWGWVIATSPDGATILAINDPNAVSHVMPTPMLAATGFHEGSLYSGGGGTQYIVARYQTGPQFAAAWGRQKLAALCAGVKLTRSSIRADVSRQINPYSQPFGITHDTGEATFACEEGALPMAAYVFAGVQTIHLPTGGGIWFADLLYGLLAPDRLAGIAAGLLSHMISSIELNPAWVSRQEQTNMDVSRIAAQTNAAVSNSIMKSWEQRGAVMDRVMEEGSRVRLGIDIYADPGSGTQYTVDNKHRYYWVNDKGRVFGTETDAQPGASFRQLQRVPPH